MGMSFSRLDPTWLWFDFWFRSKINKQKYPQKRYAQIKFERGCNHTHTHMSSENSWPVIRRLAFAPPVGKWAAFPLLGQKGHGPDSKSPCHWKAGGFWMYPPHCPNTLLFLTLSDRFLLRQIIRGIPLNQKVPRKKQKGFEHIQAIKRKPKKKPDAHLPCGVHSTGGAPNDLDAKPTIDSHRSSGGQAGAVEVRSRGILLMAPLRRWLDPQFRFEEKKARVSILLLLLSCSVTLGKKGKPFLGRPF